MIPQTYEQWHLCITKLFKIGLNVEFLNSRLVVLNNDDELETITFASTYGYEHLVDNISWFRVAKIQL